MKRCIIYSVILLLIMISISFADGFSDFRIEVLNQTKESGRPEMVFETKTFIVTIFGLETSMKEFRYDKTTDSYRVRELRKLEDSTKSPFHKEPSERLKEAIKIYGW